MKSFCSHLIAGGNWIAFSSTLEPGEGGPGFGSQPITESTATPPDAAGILRAGGFRRHGQRSGFDAALDQQAASRSGSLRPRRRERGPGHGSPPFRAWTLSSKALQESRGGVRSCATSQWRECPPSAAITLAPWVLRSRECGRTITDDDTASSPFILVVNDELADQDFAG